MKKIMGNINTVENVRAVSKGMKKQTRLHLTVQNRGALVIVLMPIGSLHLVIRVKRMHRKGETIKLIHVLL